MKNLQNTIRNAKKSLAQKICELNNVKKDTTEMWGSEDWDSYLYHCDGIRKEISTIKNRITRLEKMDKHLSKNPTGLGDMIRLKIA